ncbi:Cathepsin L-like proteinase [Gryllus bimaculatus]|nr:Cathepsin L-like proteinase [Gryllus bimaculatus]
MGSFNLLLVSILIGCVTSASVKPQPHFLSDEFIDLVNAKAKTWKAGRNFLEDVPVTYIRRLMGVHPQAIMYQLPVKELHEKEPIPEEFDSRQQWPYCPTLREIRDQGSCGSCWAFAAVEAMSDRVCIHSEGKVNFHFSSENLVSCCSSCGFGCNGGFPGAAWEYWVETGIVSGGPYGSHQHHVNGSRGPCHEERTPACHTKCETGYRRDYTKDLYHGQKSYTLMQDVEEIQLEIMKNGPVEAAFTVYEDFVQYKTGVYQHVSGSELGGHAIKIIGWGVEEDVPYWLVANSWNYDWGSQGLFKILRGKNHCGIEESVVAGIPAKSL